MNAISRRSLLAATAGLLCIGVCADDAAAQAAPPQLPPGPRPDRLSTYIAIGRDGRVTAFFGSMDMGHGLGTAIAQMVAEELDVPLGHVTVAMGDTDTSPNMGGASNSLGIQSGGIQMRMASAEARRILLARAAERWGVPVGAISVADGVLSAGAQRGGWGDFVDPGVLEVPLTWNGRMGTALAAPGQARPKPAAQHKIVGRTHPAHDVPGKVFGTLKFITDIRVPGMVHARMIRPPVAGAVASAVDVSHLPGVRAVHRGAFVAVVAEEEWTAVRAATEARVTWSDGPRNFPGHARIFEHIRAAPVLQREVEQQAGDVDAVLAGATRIIEAEYEWPFQVHASMGPACAIVEVRSDGVTLWTGSQKPHFARDGVASILEIPPERVRGIWAPGPGSYGRNDAGDAAVDAAVIAREIGRPVRLQYDRAQAHAWTPKGPASVHRMRAAIGADGRVAALEFTSKAFTRLQISSNEGSARDSLAGQMLGLAPNPTQAFGIPSTTYQVPARRLAWETVPPLMERASPLRTSHLRDPFGPQVHFASEGFMDECAAATGADPLAFRIAHLSEARDIAVLRAAAERFGWQARPFPAREAQGGVMRGRGIAYGRRNGTVCALIVEAEVERASGRVTPLRVVAAHDCGQIINPGALKLCLEGNIVQGLSRVLFEEITFDAGAVTSVDWQSYPILETAQAPRSIEVVLLNRPDAPPTGAGEAMIRPVAAALGNAVFDATGVRIRRAPLTPERVRAALASA
jgi:nicotinate dehydrogenase subunit B